MPKGVSQTYTLERRSAAARKGAAVRKRRAAMLADAVPGSQTDRTAHPGELRDTIDRALASLRAREAGR